MPLSRVTLRRQVLFLMLITCSVLMIAGCGNSVISGPCNIQGENNQVTCVQSENISTSSAAPSASQPTDSSTGGSLSGGAPSPSVATSASAISSPILMTYIENLPVAGNSDPYDTQGVAEVNGTPYPHSQGAQFCFGSNERKWTYVLDRRYSSF